MELENVIVSETEWTKKNETFSFRVWNGYLFRKEINKAFFGGYQIKKIMLAGRGLAVAKEWLEN